MNTVKTVNFQNTSIGWFFFKDDTRVCGCI